VCPGRYRSGGIGDVVSAGPVSGHLLFEHLVGGPPGRLLFLSSRSRDSRCEAGHLDGSILP
jgi:hypothetical protein